MNSLVLSPQQEQAKQAIVDWLGFGFSETPVLPYQPQFCLGGYAGTGKTTLIRSLLEFLASKHKPAVVCAFTGKAVNVLERKNISAETLHSLMYHCEPLPNGGVEFTKRNKLEYPVDLIIVDEASMVSTELYHDLCSFKKRMLFVGDPGQLEPVGNNPQLMRDPDFVLTDIHRQAADSPIIRLANDVRHGKQMTKGEFGALSIRSKNNFRIPDAMRFDQVICARNKTRQAHNKGFRLAQSRPIDSIVEGDKLIILRNNRDFAVFNGMLVFVTKIHEDAEDYWLADVKDETGRNYSRLPIWKFPFGNEMPGEFEIPKFTKGPQKDFATGKERFPTMVYADFGYVITCHKSQGSEWDKVLLWDEWMPPKIWDMARWRYTGITRAAKELTVCI